MNQIEKDDIKISIAVLSPFIVLMIQYLILLTFNLFDSGIGDLVQISSKILMMIIYLISLPIVIKRNFQGLYSIYFIAILIIMINILMFPENISSLKGLVFNFLFVSIPSLVYMMSIYEKKTFLAVLDKVASILFVLGIILLVLILSGKSSIETYSMPLCYYLLIPLLIQTKLFLNKFKLSNLLGMLLILITVMSIGSRGPLLSFIVFVILYTGFNFKRIYFNRPIQMTFLIITGLFIYVYQKLILEKLIVLLDRFNIQSRTVRLLTVDSNELHLSGRNDLYEGSLNMIAEKPFMGWGLAGEVNQLGTYSHNFFIEIMISSGVILGSIIIVIYLYYLIKNFQLSNKESRLLIMLWFSIAFIPLIVSGTYLTSIQFWILLGLMINKNFQREAIKG